MLSSKESVHTLLSLTSDSVLGTNIDVTAYTYSVTYMHKIQFIR